MKNLYELRSKCTCNSLESVTVVRRDELDRDVLDGFYSHTITKLSPTTFIEHFDGGSWYMVEVKEAMQYEYDTDDLAII